MKMSKTHWYARFLRGTKGIFRRNPVLSMGLAVPFAAVAATSLQTAVGLSIGTLMTMIPVGLLMPFLMKKIPQQFAWLDVPVCALLSALFVMPTRIIVGNISPALMDSVGVYFSLLCVSTLLFTAREATKDEENLAQILLDLLRMWLGAVMVLLLVGIFREVLGNGTLWNKPLTWMKVRFSGVMVSGMGFILLGFLAALGRKLHRIVLAVHLLLEKYIPLLKEKWHKNKEIEEQKTESAPEEESAEQLVQEISDSVLGKEQE